MIRVFEISGMHCEGCAARVRQAAQELAPGATVTLEPPRLTLPETATVDAEAIDRRLAELGDYRVTPPAG